MTDKPKTQQARSRRFLLITLIAFLVLMAILIATRDGDKGNGETNPPPDYAKTLAGSPPPLAALHEQGNELIDGGLDAFDEQMKELRGFPVVVNIWASWCHPCRAEFPHFQEVSSRLGKKVAFLGVDANDSPAKAAEFLDTSPVPYPSFIDPDNEITNELGSPVGLPATAFFDSSGKQTFLKQGPYTSEEQLEKDIQANAIQGGSG